MNYYENVVVEYLRADRALFVNTDCCVQLSEAENPDKSGPHWYCDVVAADFRDKAVYLCEISYSANLNSMIARLTAWHRNWSGVLTALARDCSLPVEWPVRPWLFVPEELVALLLDRLAKIDPPGRLSFRPRITPLELVQPWRYPSWRRVGEAMKPSVIPPEMRA
jgi:hypothetical protein